MRAEIARLKRGGVSRLRGVAWWCPSRGRLCTWAVDEKGAHAHAPGGLDPCEGAVRLLRADEVAEALRGALAECAAEGGRCLHSHVHRQPLEHLLDNLK